MKKLTWRLLRIELSKVLRISPEILDFLADYDIMLLSISGLSNKDVSETLNIPVTEIQNVLERNIGIYADGWNGFKSTSSISPYARFKYLSASLKRIPSEQEFCEYMYELTSKKKFNNISLHLLYKIILTFSTMRYKYLTQYRKEENEHTITRHTS